MKGEGKENVFKHMIFLVSKYMYQTALKFLAEKFGSANSDALVLFMGMLVCCEINDNEYCFLILSFFAGQRHYIIVRFYSTADTYYLYYLVYIYIYIYMNILKIYTLSSKYNFYIIDKRFQKYIYY